MSKKDGSSDPIGQRWRCSEPIIWKKQRCSMCRHIINAKVPEGYTSCLLVQVVFKSANQASLFEACVNAVTETCIYSHNSSSIAKNEQNIKMYWSSWHEIISVQSMLHLSMAKQVPGASTAVYQGECGNMKIPTSEIYEIGDCALSCHAHTLNLFGQVLMQLWHI